MNNDLISRDALIKAVEDLYEYAELGEVLDVIKEAPAVELTETEIQEVLNKRCMSAVANEYLIALHGKRPRGTLRRAILDNTPEVPSNMTLIPTAVLDDLTKTTRELGEWVEDVEPFGYDETAVAVCSVCRSEYCLGEMSLSDVRREFKYCPNCGALMVNAGNNETE